MATALVFLPAVLCLLGKQRKAVSYRSEGVNDTHRRKEPLAA
jgi:hypothetical protein